MAYYDDGYMWPQQHTTFDPVAYQDSVSFSSYYDLDSYTFSEPKFINHYDYNNSYVINNYVEPKLIGYETVKNDTVFYVSYSVSNSEFNEPEFEEYDPTPYGGGYDIVSVYGKPLPPSDQTCYPRSNPTLKPNLENETVPVPVPVPVLMPPPPRPPRTPTRVTFVEPEPEPFNDGEREREEYSYTGYGYDYPWPEYDNGYGIEAGYDVRYGKQVVQIPPYEYNPEVVDLCENMFGSWPCLARIRKQQMRMVDNNPGIAYPHHNPWEDYIFGGPMTSYNQ